MKNFQKTIAILFIILSVNFSANAQAKSYFGVGIQYFNQDFDRISGGNGTTIPVGFAGIKLALSGDYKYAKYLSGGIQLGILGKETFGAEVTKYANINIDPIRLHIGSDISGFYIGPRLNFSSASSNNGLRFSGTSMGLSFGMIRQVPNLPLAFSINAAVIYEFTGRAEIGSVASFTAGYSF